MTSFQAEERSDLSALEGAADVAGAERKLEPLRIHRDEPAGDVELLELNPREARVFHFTGDVDRPELRADHSLLQPVEVGVAAGFLAQVIVGNVHRRCGVLADRPCEVVVSVDQRSGCEDFAGTSQILLGGLGRH